VGGLETITVADTGGALSETEGTAKEGKNAEYSIDGVAGTSTTNVLSAAIPGVSLTLSSLTSTGPVSIAVQAPAIDPKAVEARVQSFVTLYNTTVEEIQKEMTTRPPLNPANAEELATGTLFGDRDLSNLLNQMRQTMYEPIAGLAAEMSSPADIGLSTGAPGSSSAGALTGLLVIDPAKLAAGVQANPEGAKLMLRQWSTNINNAINVLAEPGGTLESRINGDNTQIREMKQRITTMNEMLALRQKALEQTYARLEGVISKNTATGSWLTEQAAQLTANSKA
jgi:flagellar hook-associated protein 2